MLTEGRYDMVEKCIGMGLVGAEPFKVIVEADITRGLPSYDMVGLPDAAVKESRGRVRAAMCNSGFDYPVGKITINLAPAHIKKGGPLYDLPILIAIMKLLLDSKTDLCFSILKHVFSWL